MARDIRGEVIARMIKTAQNMKNLSCNVIFLRVVNSLGLKFIGMAEVSWIRAYKRRKIYVNASCITDKAPAMGSRNSLAVNSYIDTSSVANSAPPRISTTPKLVKQNVKQSSADDTMEGSNRGKVT